MRQYIKPEIEVIRLSLEGIISVSNPGFNPNDKTGTQLIDRKRNSAWDEYENF